MRLRTFFIAGLALFIAAACTTKIPEGQPLPELTYSHLAPIKLNAANISIENHYNPSLDPQDMSSGFPTPPDIVIRRYLENRFEASAMVDEIVFSIDESRVHERIEGTTGTFQNLLGGGRTEIYDVMIKLRLYSQDDAGFQSDHSVMTFNRQLSIPASFSLADKEKEKLAFLEAFVNDLDKALITVIEQKNLLGTDSPTMFDQTPLDLLAPPEGR